MCTGLEPLLLGMGASAGVASIGASALGALGAGALAKQVMPKQTAPQITPPEKPPQASKQPDRPAIVAANGASAGAGGAMAGNSGTFLTGPGGVDSSTLNLGKNTLLGQ